MDARRSACSNAHEVLSPIAGAGANLSCLPRPAPPGSWPCPATRRVATWRHAPTIASAKLRASPPTVYVDDAYAGGANDGSESRPWTTIQQAIDAAADGAVIAIAEGSYVADVEIDNKRVRLWGRCRRAARDRRHGDAAALHRAFARDRGAQPGGERSAIRRCRDGRDGDPDPTTQPSPKPPPPAWPIEPGRVGAIELGKPLPEALLTPDLEARYIARYFADAQPMEGFRYDDPPLTVVLESGPFAKYLDEVDEPREPPLDQLRGKAVEVARTIAIKRVMIHGEGPATKAGAAVGRTLAALKSAYPDIKLSPLPETFGDDLCSATTKSLANVAFVFATCAQANEGGAVKRIDLWSAE